MVGYEIRPGEGTSPLQLGQLLRTRQSHLLRSDREQANRTALPTAAIVLNGEDLRGGNPAEASFERRPEESVDCP